MTWLLTSVAGGLMAVIAIDYVAVESNVRVLRLEMARIGTHKIVSEPPTLRLLSQWGAYLNFARIEPKSGMDKQTLAWMATVVERFPYAIAQYNLAVAYGLNGRPGDARTLLARLCHLHKLPICAAQLDEWRTLAIEFPALAAVPLPVTPPAAAR